MAARHLRVSAWLMGSLGLAAVLLASDVVFITAFAGLLRSSLAERAKT
jgi:hypothetical protein